MNAVHEGKNVRITDEHMKHYEEQGYILFENLFSPEEIDEVRGPIDEMDTESERALREKGKDGISHAGQINFTAGLNFRDPKVQRFIADRRLVDITTRILGPDIRLYWDQSVYKRPEAPRDFPWHQDNSYVPTEPIHYVTCWLALEDSTLENGCIWVQPGTHRKGFVPHIKTDIGLVCYYGDIEGTPVELKKGSMVAFHSLLFHRSMPNRSKTDTRKGYVMQYSVEGSFNPNTGALFRNGPLIAQNGQSCYSGFLSKDQI